MVDALFTMLATRLLMPFQRGTQVGANAYGAGGLQGGSRFAKGAHLPRGAALAALVDYAVVAELVDAQR